MANTTNYPHRNADTLYSASDEFVTALGLENRPVIKGELHGVYGWAGLVFDYLNQQPHLEQMGWCFQLTGPAAFARLPAGKTFASLCKAFFENRSQSFDGLRLQVDFSFQSVEWTGHIMSIPSGATRSQGSVTHTAIDVEGEVFTKLFDVWGRWLIMDPELQNAKIIILDDPGPLLLDDQSCTNIYFTPTRNLRDVAHAALNIGMMPKSLVPIEIKRDKTSEREMRTIQMEFTGLLEWDTLAVKQIARGFLKRLPLYNPDAVAAPSAFLNPTATVDGAAGGTLKQMDSEKIKVSKEPASTADYPGAISADEVGYLG